MDFQTLSPKNFRHKQCALLFGSDGAASILHIPPIGNCSIHQFLEIQESLVQGFGLLFNRHTSSLHLFEVMDALGLDGGECGIIKFSTLMDVPNNLRSKVLHAHGDDAKHGGACLKIADLFLVGHLIAIGGK